MHVEELKRCVPVFGFLPEKDLARIADSVKPKKFDREWLLFREGEKDQRLYILTQGEVEIIKALDTPDERLLAVREACTLLGELSLFSEDGSHTASVRAQTDLELLELDLGLFNRLLNTQSRFAYELIRTLAHRLVDSEELTIRDLRRKNRELEHAYQDLERAQVHRIEKEKYEHELEVARRIQMSMLPRKPLRIPRYNYFARIVPMIGVGGDFFDFIALDDERFGLAIGDVSDHGVPAALFMAQTATLLRMEAKSGAAPDHVLRKVNQHLMGMNEAGMFVTLLYGILDTAKRTFHFARAGHELPLILSGDGFEVGYEHQRGQPLGILEDPLLDQAEIELPKGSVMGLYTDGITDTINAEMKRFGLERFRASLAGAIQERAREAVDRIWSDNEAFRGEVEQFDDLTLFILKAH